MSTMDWNMEGLIRGQMVVVNALSHSALSGVGGENCRR